MPPALNLNPPASSAAAPWGLGPPSGLHFPMGTDKPKEGATMIPKKEENGEKYATATTEAEFHAALNRGEDVELTHELAEKIGLMAEDVGTLEDIKAAKFDPYN